MQHTATFTITEPSEEVARLRELLAKHSNKNKNFYENAILQEAAKNDELRKEIAKLNLAIAEFSEMASEVKIAGQVSIPENTKVCFNGFTVQWKEQKLIIETVTKDITIKPMAPNRIVLL